MILTCFALEDPVLIHQFTFIILVSEASDFPFPQGWLFSDVSIKTAAGCMRALNPAAALRYLPHSDVKAPKPPHWACSDGTASGSVDRSFAVLCTREGWESYKMGGRPWSWDIWQWEAMPTAALLPDPHTNSRTKTVYSKQANMSRLQHKNFSWSFLNSHISLSKYD